MLTDSKLKSLKPGPKPYKVVDRDGMYAYIATSGTVSFRLDYRLNRRRETLTLGRYGSDSLNLGEAREAAQKARKLVSQGISPCRAKRKERTAHHFAHWAAEWLNHRKWAAKTLEQRQNLLDKDILPAIGKLTMAEIGTHEVRELINGIKARGAPSVALQAHEIIGQVFRHAINSGGEEARNPAESIKSGTIAVRKRRERALSHKEIRTFLHFLELVDTPVSNKLALRLILLTLVRKRELTQARWTEFDLDAGLWVIPAERMKGKRVHVVYLSTQAVAMLRELHQLAGDSDYVLPHRNGALPDAVLNRVIYAVLKLASAHKLPMERFTVHDLRRTGSTLLNEAGFNSDWIEKCLAHEQKGTRAVYNKAEYAEQRRDMLQRWADLVIGE